MAFPERPTIHGETSLGGPVVWRDPERAREPYGEDFRRCSYCGSIHPEDLLRHLRAGASPHGADWKYGWPHKFYVEGVPNLLAGKTVRCGTAFKRADGKDFEEPIMGAAPATVHVKWYNEHLLDEGYDEATRAELIEALAASGIRFEIVDGRLRYSAPHRGYQR